MRGRRYCEFGRPLDSHEDIPTGGSLGCGCGLGESGGLADAKKYLEEVRRDSRISAFIGELPRYSVRTMREVDAGRFG